jgi:hypothetical protein
MPIAASIARFFVAAAARRPSGRGMTKKILFLLLASTGVASATPPCFNDQPMPVMWLVADVGVLDTAGTRPDGADYELCATSGELSLGGQDAYREMVRPQGASFRVTHRLHDLTDGATALVARADATDPAAGQIRLVARPGAGDTVIVTTEVRETAGSFAYETDAVTLPLPADLRIEKNGNIIRTMYRGKTSSGGQGWFTQLSMAHIGTDLAAPTLYAGPAVAAELADKAIARWGPSPLLSL